MPPSLAHPKYRADIDGLRAIAVLSVVGFHAFPELIEGGFIGVDIFFVISGFLISTILFESFERGSFSISEFYARRIKRIFPALLIVLISCFVFGWFALLANEFKQLGKHIAGGAGFISNFVFWNEAGYFDFDANDKPLLHLWSLGIEEQFYIVWPLLLMVALKKQYNLLAIILLIMSISFALNVKGIHPDAVATFYSPQTRFWELMCGALLARLTLYKHNVLSGIRNELNCWVSKNLCKHTPKINSCILDDTQSALGLMLIVCGLYKITTDAPFPGILALLPTFGAALIISAGDQAWINRAVLSNRVLVWFGLISFPLYLWHWPLLSFLRMIESEPPSANLRIAVVALSILLAWLTYKFIERPFRFGKYDKENAIALVLIMIIVGSVGYNTYNSDGFGFRLNQTSANAKVIFANTAPPTINFDCKDYISELGKYEFDGGCRLSSKLAPEIIFIGDSHTAHFHSAIWKAFPDNSVMMVVQSSCLPFSGDFFLKDNCKRIHDAVLFFLKSNKSIKKIFLSGYWNYLMSGGFGDRGYNWRSVRSLDPESVASFTKNGKFFLQSILETKKDIIFMKDIPDLDFNVKSCYETRPLTLRYITRKNCTLNYANYKARTAAYDNVIDGLLKGYPQIKVIDPRPLFCDLDNCSHGDGSLPYYFNGDHLNWYGADMVIRNLFGELSSGPATGARKEPASQ